MAKKKILDSNVRLKKMSLLPRIRLGVKMQQYKVCFKHNPKGPLH